MSPVRRTARSRDTPQQRRLLSVRPPQSCLGPNGVTRPGPMPLNSQPATIARKSQHEIDDQTLPALTDDLVADEPRDYAQYDRARNDIIHLLCWARDQFLEHDAVSSAADACFLFKPMRG